MAKESLMKRLVLIGLLLLISAATAEAIDKVRMSISAVDVSFLTGGLALKRGMFRDEGLDVELIRMNANVSVTALSTGDIDYTWCSRRWCVALCADCR
jgi:ABC-type nitrate/sulfonate/bicarbonate transport system substrate-binding protein